LTGSSCRDRGRPVARIEVVLELDGGCWRGRGDGVFVEADDASELDDRIARAVAESGRFAPGTPVQVFLACDRSVIPAWMRPYQSHYFNRTISFVVGEGGNR